MALQRLLAWRKEAYEKWVGKKPFRVGAETWILPDNVAKQLSQKCSWATTAEEVEAIAWCSNWAPLGGKVNRFTKIVQVLAKLNNEINDCHELVSQTMAASTFDQPDGSDDDGDRSNGEEDLLESESESPAGAGAIGH